MSSELPRSTRQDRVGAGWVSSSNNNSSSSSSKPQTKKKKKVSVRWQQARPNTAASQRTGRGASPRGVTSTSSTATTHHYSQQRRPNTSSGRTSKSTTTTTTSHTRAHAHTFAHPRARAKRKPRRVERQMTANEVPTTEQGVLRNLVEQLTNFVDGKRRELDTLAFSAKEKRKTLDSFTHKLHNLIGQADALGLEVNSDVVESKELMEILLDKEHTLGMKFPQEWRLQLGEGGRGKSKQPVERSAISPTANNFTVNKSISRKAVFARGTDIDEKQAELDRNQTQAKELAHTIKQHQHMRDRLYKSNLALKRSTTRLDEYIAKMKAKDRQLVRAIESEEQKRALAHHKFADAEKVRKQQLQEKQTQLKQANVAVTASNNMHMLLVSQAQLKKNVELKMAGDMDEADERRLNKKYTKSLIVRKMQQLKQTDDEELERKFQQALHTLGLKGTVQDTDTDEVIAIVQRQHEVAVELEQKKQSLSAHIASLREQIVDAKQQIEDAMYGTSDHAAQELAELDSQLITENEELRETREHLSVQTGVVSDMRFALNSVMLDFLGVDCAVTDDIDVINKLVTKVLNRVAALVRFGGSLLAADKTPVPDAVEEATQIVKDSTVTVDEHFSGRRSRSSSPTSRSNTDNAEKARAQDKNVRVRTEAELEVAEEAAVLERERAAKQVAEAEKQHRLKFASKATAGLVVDDGPDDSDDAMDPMSRRELKMAAVHLVQEQKAAELNEQKRAKQAQKTKHVPGYLKPKSKEPAFNDYAGIATSAASSVEQPESPDAGGAREASLQLAYRK